MKMTEKVKKDVHPAFVEIIKQLSPDEARILRYLNAENVPQPMIALLLEKVGERGWNEIIKHFTILYRTVPGLEYNDYNKVSILLDNLSRQNLIVFHENNYISNPNRYDDLENDSVIQHYMNQSIPNHKWKTVKMYYELTAFGESFCRVCIADPVEKTIGEQR